MMKCWKCGREVAETSNFCGRCGAPLKINAIRGTADESAANRNTADRKSAGGGAGILGIDLGGSTARIAVIRDGRPVVIPGRNGEKGCPAAVGFRDGRLIVGEEAQRQADTRPGDTALNFKARMGSGIEIPLGGKTYTPQLLSALVLKKLRMDAKAYLNEVPEDAIITIPNSYTYRQRQAVLEAGRMAGLKVNRLISNTAAASLGTGWYGENAGRVLLCSMGSVSFDVSVTEFTDGVAEVLASGGSTTLGGNDFTECIARWILSRFRLDTGIDLKNDPVALARVYSAAETAKKQLSELTSAQITIPCAGIREGQPLHFDETLTRSEFEEMTLFLRERARGLILGVLYDAKLSPNDLQRVVFVGGGSRIPSMKNMVLQVTGREITKIARPEECAACGAAILGGVRHGDIRDVLLLDVTPFSLGIETAGGVFTKLIPRDTTIPIKKAQVFSTFEDNQVAVDVHVLEGEGVQAAENETIGSFRISGIPPAKRGVPLIEVTFDVDQNGVFSMHAKDVATGKEQRLEQLDRPAGTEERVQRGTALVNEAASRWGDVLS